MFTSSLRPALAGLFLATLSLPGWAAEPELRHATNGAARIEYTVSGAGPLVVFLASTGRGTAEFEALADRLTERGFRVALPEPRGIGSSEGPMDNVSFHDFGDDFAAVIRAEGGPAIVAGHAYGNWIARTMAHDHPDLVRGVVMVAAGAEKWPAELSDAITMINDPAASEEQKIAGLKLAFFAEGNDPRPWLEGWHQDVTASQRAARKLTERDIYRGGHGKPILDLQGGADPFRPESSRNEVRDELGEAVTIKVIANTSHALPAEKPLETADAIADWAQTLP